MTLRGTSSSPIVIVGAHGGGTSFTTKLLRLQGFFAGSDAGDVRARKWHESAYMVAMNEALLQSMGISQSSRSNSVVAEYRQWEEECADDLQTEIAREFLTQMNAYWGDTQPCVSWGWKDPRGALTARFVNEVFPGTRFVIIRKQPDPTRECHSDSGRWFNKEASPEAIDLLCSTPGVPVEQCFTIDFENITDPRQFNDLLQWCRLCPMHTASQMEELLRNADFE